MTKKEERIQWLKDNPWFYGCILSGETCLMKVSGFDPYDKQFVTDIPTGFDLNHWDISWLCCRHGFYYSDAKPLSTFDDMIEEGEQGER
jgi:hypothetical protein